MNIEDYLFDRIYIADSSSISQSYELRDEDFRVSASLLSNRRFISAGKVGPALTYGFDGSPC
jgi:hypothetical protein